MLSSRTYRNRPGIISYAKPYIRVDFLILGYPILWPCRDEAYTLTSLSITCFSVRQGRLTAVFHWHLLSHVRANGIRNGWHDNPREYHAISVVHLLGSSPSKIVRIAKCHFRYHPCCRMGGAELLLVNFCADHSARMHR